MSLYPSAMPKFTHRDSHCARPALCKSESILPSERQQAAFVENKLEQVVGIVGTAQGKNSWEYEEL